MLTALDLTIFDDFNQFYLFVFVALHIPLTVCFMFASVCWFFVLAYIEQCAKCACVCVPSA